MAEYGGQIGQVRRGVLCTLCSLLFLSACAGGNHAVSPSPPTGIAGKVTFGGEPVAGAVVGVYRSLEDYRMDEAAGLAGPTGENGDFSIDLPPGKYYVTANADSPGETEGKLFNFHGSNPLSVTAGARLPIGLSLAPLTPPPRYVDRGAGAGILSGTVTHGGEPLAGAVAFLYLGEQADFKGTPYAVAPPTDGGGAFEISGLIESGYYVVVRKRSGNRMAGPLAPGDYYGFYPHNPLRIEDGKRVEIVVEAIMRPDDPRAANRGERSSPTRIEGTIVDTGGSPRGGLYAFVYPGRIMSHAKPLAISEPTGADGRFILSLERGGKVFLGARQNYGTNPLPGEFYGKYTGSPDHSITVDDGEIRRGITIVVEPILE